MVHIILYVGTIYMIVFWSTHTHKHKLNMIISFILVFDDIGRAHKINVNYTFIVCVYLSTVCKRLTCAGQIVRH